MNLNDLSTGIQCELDRLHQRVIRLQDSIVGPSPQKDAGNKPQEPGLIGKLKVISELTSVLHGRMDHLEEHLSDNCNQLGSSPMAQQVATRGILR